MKRLTEANYFYHFDFQSKKKNYKEETQSITKYITKYIYKVDYQSFRLSKLGKK
jgi:hypothetical protein